MKYMIQFISSDGSKTEGHFHTWKDAKSAMRKSLTLGAVRAVAYERLPKCNAYSHIAEWTWQETDLLK